MAYSTYHHTPTGPRPTYSRSSRTVGITCNAAAASTPGISLKRYADAQPAAVVTERRAADVAVLGSSTAAVLAAYTLAKSGRKVLLLPDYGLAAATPKPRPLQPLKLPDPDPLLTHLAAESAAYWGGLQALSGTHLLAEQQSLDVVLDPELDHPGALGFSLLEAACAAVGVPASLLTGSEVNSSFRQLQLPPHRSSGLLQPNGGVLRATQAAAVACQLAAGVGVMMREGLALRGWRDRGSCFELRASSLLAPDAVTCLYEAEVLLLAPGPWAAHCMDLFGLQLEGLQVRELICSRAAVSNAEQLQQLPLVSSWGAAAAAAADALQQPEGFTLLPPGTTGEARVSLQQGAAWGLPVVSPFDWQQLVLKPTAALEEAEQQQQQQQQQQQEEQLGGNSMMEARVQQLHASCSSLFRGLAPLQHPSCSSSTTLVNTTTDGRPLVGIHPGFDAGRVVVCCGAVGSKPYGPGSSSSSYQLSPMLAKLAADVIKSGGVSSSGAGDQLLSGVCLQREGMGAASTLQQLNAWEGLDVLQQQQAASALEEEEQQDLARDAEQDLIGTKQ